MNRLDLQCKSDTVFIKWQGISRNYKGETLLNVLSPTRAGRVLRSMYRCKVILSEPR